MQCSQFEQILEQQDDSRLPKPALDHIDACEACRALAADLDAIQGLALELDAEGIAPPERVWISLRTQLEAEGVIRDLRSNRQPAASSFGLAWWAAFQRPALAGAVLSVILLGGALIGYEGGGISQIAMQPLVSPQESSVAFSDETVFKQETLTVGSDLPPGLQSRDAAVMDSIRRNLGIVDKFIAMCEKSVREQPHNEMAREYLYGAYQQKAELLATATNRSVTGGMQ